MHCPCTHHALLALCSPPIFYHQRCAAHSTLCYVRQPDCWCKVQKYNALMMDALANDSEAAALGFAGILQAPLVLLSYYSVCGV